MKIIQVIPDHIDLEGKTYKDFEAEIHTDDSIYYLECEIEASYSKCDISFNCGLGTEHHETDDIENTEIKIIDGNSINDSGNCLDIANVKELQQILTNKIQIE